MPHCNARTKLSIIRERLTVIAHNLAELRDCIPAKAEEYFALRDEQKKLRLILMHRGSHFPESEASHEKH